MVNFPAFSKVAALAERFRRSEFVYGTSLGAVVGLGTGLGAVAFRRLIESFQSVFFWGGAEHLSFLGNYYVIPIPAVGGIIVGVLLYFSKVREA